TSTGSSSNSTSICSLRSSASARVGATHIAIASPTKRTLPCASGCHSESLYPGTVVGATIAATPARSSRMKTWFSAPRGLTMRRMWPCAMGLRRKATSLCPGSSMSDTKLPRPCRWRASSLRWTLAPIPCVIFDPGCKATQRSPPAVSSHGGGTALAWLCGHREAVVVERVFGDAEPEIRIRQEFLPGFVNQLEVWILGGELIVSLEGRFVTGVQDRARKLPQLDAARQQATQCLGVSRVVLGHHQDRRLATRGLKRSAVGFRQRLPVLEIDEKRDLSTAFPPARIVVVPGDLMQPELLVIVRTDPLGSIDGAAFERRINIGGGDLQRDNAELRQDHAAESADAELESFEVVDRVDLLAVEATHLHADIAAGNGQDSILLEQRADEFEAAAVIHPRLLLARIESEREPGIERDRGVLANIERGKGVAALDRAVLRRVPDLQRRHDLAAGKALDLEFLIGDLPYALTHGLDAAVKRIEAFRPARCQPPTHRGRGLSNRRACNGGRRHARARPHEKRTPLHFGCPAEINCSKPAPVGTCNLFLAVASACNVDKSLPQPRARASMTVY